MDRKQAEEVYEHFQLMDDELHRQYQEYYMSQGEIELVSIMNGDFPSDSPKKRNKGRLKNQKLIKKNVQKQKLKDTKEEQRRLFHSELKFLEESDRSRVNGWVFLLLRRIKRKNPESDIQLASQIIYLKAQESQINIPLENIEHYLREHMNIIRKCSSVVKRKLGSPTWGELLHQQQNKNHS